MKLPAHFFVSESDGHMYDTRHPHWYKRPPIRPDYAAVKLNVRGNTIALRAAIRQAYSWPGGYEIVGITCDGGCLCNKCMRANYKQIAWSVRQACDDGWLVDAVYSSADYDELTCDHCGRVIVGEEQ